MRIICTPDMTTSPKTKAEALEIVENLRLYIETSNVSHVTLETHRDGTCRMEVVTPHITYELTGSDATTTLNH